MRKVLEAVFRHPLRILLLLLVPAVAGLALGLMQPRSYQSTSALWALQPYAVVSADSTPNSSTVYGVTPAQTQAGALTDLLLTRQFPLSVANAAGLAAQLPRATAANPQLRDDTLVSEIQRNTIVTPVGTNLYTVSYANQSPAMAQRVVKDIITTYTSNITGLSNLEGQYLLGSYQQQLLQSQDAAATAARAVATYRLKHPAVANLDAVQAQSQDPQYALLLGESQNAQSAVLNIESEIANLQQQVALQGEGTNTLFRVVDTPNLPALAVSRTKVLLLYAGGGVALGILACTLYLTFVVRRDRSVLTLQDAEGIAGLTVLLQVPRLPQRAVAAATLTHETLVAPPGA